MINVWLYWPPNVDQWKLQTSKYKKIFWSLYDHCSFSISGDLLGSILELGVTQNIFLIGTFVYKI